MSDERSARREGLGDANPQRGVKPARAAETKTRSCAIGGAMRAMRVAKMRGLCAKSPYLTGVFSHFYLKTLADKGSLVTVFIG
jgi:hypothetical protein